MKIKQTRAAGGGRSAGLGTGMIGSDGPLYRDIGVQSGYTGGYHDSPDSTIARRHQQHAHIDHDPVELDDDETDDWPEHIPNPFMKYSLLEVHDMTDEEVAEEFETFPKLHSRIWNLPSPLC